VGLTFLFEKSKNKDFQVPGDEAEEQMKHQES